MIWISGSVALYAQLCGTTKRKQMRFFALTFDKVLLRFFLMMTCVIVGLFAGQPLLALLALPIFLSAVLGVSFIPEGKQKADPKAQVLELPKSEVSRKAV